jgi:hypothetical protein
MLSTGFEPTISASERPQTHALDRADTGIGSQSALRELYEIWFKLRPLRTSLLSPITERCAS